MATESCCLIDDMKSALTCVRKNGLALELVCASLRNNKPLVTTAVRKNGLALKFASPTLQSDLGVVAKACAQTAEAIKHARFMQTADTYSTKDANIVRQVVLEAVRISGLLLKYAPRWLRNDSRVVDAALNQNEAALAFAFPGGRPFWGGLSQSNAFSNQRCNEVCSFFVFLHVVGALSVAAAYLIQYLARQ